MKNFVLMPLLLLAVCASCRKPQLEDRIDDILGRMTIEEKVRMLHAQSKFSSAGVQRLGIPELWTDDGPHGIRCEVFWDQWENAGWTNDSCVAFPALTCLAATWDKELAMQYGVAIGEEARYRKKDVLLGPGVNIYRSPLCGRNFEYLGEDPFLAGKLAAQYIRGVQTNGVAACVKHFCLNNEESHRHTIDVEVSDRALYEIYLPAFKAAVQEGGAWSIMGSYNLYRGQHCCHNDRLINGILKDEWDFDGAVISDWGGCHDTDEAIRNGLDLEFGTMTDGLSESIANQYDYYYLANPYLERLRDGRAGEEQLNDKVRRVLRLMMRTSMNPDKPFGSKCSPQHYAVARTIESNGIVLLKNDGAVLPVNEDVKTIAVIGENAVKMMTVGGGSSSLKAQHEIGPLQGIRERAALSGIEVKYARGYVGSVSRSYNGVNTGMDLSDNRSAEELVEEACELASSADLTIFVGGLNKDKHQDCEGRDRYDMDLPYNQNEVIEAIARVCGNHKLVVCLVSGNAVSMPWIDDVPAIAQVWYGGSEAGHGIADVLFGDVNPSGKLPFTFPIRLEDSPAHIKGTTFPNDNVTVYNEGIYVGYRWFEHKDIRPLFAFGHGLSYTEFEYGSASVSRSSMRTNGSVCIKVPVRNAGSVAGAEVVQLYIRDSEASVDRPEKELKGFEKIYLEPGESTTVQFTISADALSYFDEASHSWIAEPGEFVACIGSASDDIRTSVKFKLK